jgi:hypothetical protein
MTPRSAFVLAIAVGAVSPVARAQGTAEAFVHDAEHPNALRLLAEMDPAVAFGVGFVRAVDLGTERFHRRAALHVDTTAILGLSSWDLAGGVTAPLVDGVGFDALATTELELKLVQNDVHSGLVYGCSAALRPGWFGSTWYASADLALHGTIAATIRHSDGYRALFPDVADGTYTTGNLSGFVGAATGVRIARRGMVGLRFAWRIPRTLDSYAPYFQPYTLNLEVGARFPSARR